MEEGTPVSKWEWASVPTLTDCKRQLNINSEENVRRRQLKRKRIKEEIRNVELRTLEPTIRLRVLQAGEIVGVEGENANHHVGAEEGEGADNNMAPSVNDNFWEWLNNNNDDTSDEGLEVYEVYDTKKSVEYDREYKMATQGARKSVDVSNYKEENGIQRQMMDKLTMRDDNKEVTTTATADVKTGEEFFKTNHEKQDDADKTND